MLRSVILAEATSSGTRRYAGGRLINVSARILLEEFLVFNRMTHPATPFHHARTRVDRAGTG
jgi:hypothetical protein